MKLSTKQIPGFIALVLMMVLKFFSEGVAAESGALSLPQDVKINNDGTIVFEKTIFSIQCFNSKWRCKENSSWQDVKTANGENAITTSGNITIDNIKGGVRQVVTSTTPDTFQVLTGITFPVKTNLKEVAGVLAVPVDQISGIIVDGKKYKLPEKYTDVLLVRDIAAKKVQLTLPGGRRLSVTGKFTLRVQDNRKFNQNNFNIRFGFSPRRGSISSTRLALEFKTEQVSSQPVSISSCANRSFADRDGSGWTGQGSRNDLSMLRPGKIKYGLLSFDIPDTVNNNGKSAIVVAGENRYGFAREVTLKLDAEHTTGSINLLHASAWSPPAGTKVGTITVKYSDKSEEVIPVTSRKDIGDWWSPMPYENAHPVWMSRNKQSEVGLYASSFALKKKPVDSLVFKSADKNAVWMVAGVSLATDTVSFPRPINENYIIKAGHDWVKLEFSGRIEENSPVDFSFMLDAPAGKYGRVVSRNDGTLGFTSGGDKRFRLFGVNLCRSANYADKKTVDIMVRDLVKCGYNSVRIHHHDSEILDPNATDTTTFNPEKLDRLDYLFAVLKKHGLYITVDMYSSRIFKPGDKIPECDFYNMPQMKGLLPISSAAMDNWKTFTAKLLNHVNKYTAIAWKDDPALFCINLVNEETLSNNWKKHPSLVRLYKKAFARWKESNNISEGIMKNDNPVFRRFLYELQYQTLVQQINFIRNEIKSDILLTSLNYINNKDTTLLKNMFDIVDNHIYFDHPSFPGKKWHSPWRYRQNSVISNLADVPRRIMPNRIFSKPFIVTEFNYCNPNKYRAAGGPLMGAYAALQNWDGLFRFSWSHTSRALATRLGAKGFDSVNDPLAQLSDRISQALFIRGDFKPAKERYGCKIVKQKLFAQEKLYPLEFETLGLITQIGSVIGGSKNTQSKPVVVLSACGDDKTKLVDSKIQRMWQRALSRKNFSDSTGQITLDPEKNSLIVDTPKTQSITLEKGDLSSSSLKVKNADSFQSISAISLDNLPLETSRSILVIHLTNLLNTGSRFTNKAMIVLTKQGKTPLLIRKGKAQLSISGATYRVHALSATGKVTGEVKTEQLSGRTWFTLDTASFPGGTLIYHIERQTRL